MTLRYNIFRNDVFRFFSKMTLGVIETLNRKRDTLVIVEGKKYTIPYRDPSDLYGRANDMAMLVDIVENSKTIVFNNIQAEIFTHVNQEYFGALDFRLPFQKVFLQFSEPIVIDYKLRSHDDIDRGKLIAVALDQTTLKKEQVEEDKKKAEINHAKYGLGPAKFYNFDFDGNDEIVLNRAIFLYEDWGIDRIAWQSSGTDENFVELDQARFDAISLWKNVVIACIGYINCENIYLQIEGQVPDKVNAKRERKGKSKLEPYYVCRIRGVQYNSDGSEKGTGSKQSIRYDVRGHFRRYESGKTTWVRAHQRGLTNELYVPKTYVVDKKAQA